MDYIYFSTYTGQKGENFGTCAQECGKGLFAQKCCASITTTGGTIGGGKKDPDFWYTCIDRSMGASDMTMNIANNSVNIKCVDSGSMRIAGLTVSALLALASTM